MIDIEMELDKVVIDEKKHEHFAVLKEKGGKGRLSISIGFAEAQHIKNSAAVSAGAAGTELSGIQPHSFAQSVIEALGAKVQRVRLPKEIDNRLHAELILLPRDKDREVAIDARPSDGISLALRFQAPIFTQDWLADFMEKVFYE